MGPRSMDKVLGLRRLTRRVTSLFVMPQSWLWMFLGFCFLAAVVSAPAALTGGPGHGTSPAAKLQHTLVAADVARIPQSQAPARIPQQIMFGQPQGATVGQQVTLTASSVTTASSPVGTGLTVSFRSDTPTVCTVSGSALTPVSPGTCVITAVQGGDDTYAPAPDVAHASQVRAGQVTQDISFTLPANMTVGVADTPGGQGSGRAAGIPLGHAGRVCRLALCPHAGGPRHLRRHRLPGRQRKVRPGSRRGAGIPGPRRAGHAGHLLHTAGGHDRGRAGHVVGLRRLGGDRNVPLGHTAGVQRLGIRRHPQSAGHLRDHCRPGRQRRLRASARRSGRIPGPRRAGHAGHLLHTAGGHDRR